jgi:type II secretory pathway pseudopilin PulG
MYRTLLKVKKVQKSGGFTVIELLIATTVFSVVLLIFLISFLRIGQLFYKGVSITNTQETARSVIQDMTDDMQFSNVTPQIDPAGNYFCIGNHRYAINKGFQVGSAPGYGILREDLANCPPLTGSAFAKPPDPSKGTELLGPGMQVNELTASQFSTDLSPGAIYITIHLVFYGDDKSVLTSSDPAYAGKEWKAPDAVCTGNEQSTQFCAVADYRTTILQGLNF